MKNDFFKQLFALYDREKFADWLWRGLHSFYTVSPVERATTFDNAGHLILQYESICEGIAAIYEDFVPANKQLSFRQAIGDVLREKSADHSDLLPAFQDLIYLIIRLKANESLSALLPTVGNGVLGQRYPDILYETITALGSLAPSDYAYKTAFNLIDSANFDDGYLFEAIKVLVECKPSDTAKIVLTFEPRLTQLYMKTKHIGGVEFKVFCDAAEDWAEFLLSRGTISWLSELWKKASHLPDQVWIFNFLFGNKSMPVIFNMDCSTDTYWINYRSKKVKVKVSEKDYHTRDMLLHKFAIEEIFAWANNPKDKVYAIPLPEWRTIGSDKIQFLGQRILPKVLNIATRQGQCSHKEYHLNK